MRNLSYENEFCMQFHSHANQSHFHKNGFALRLALKQRHKGTRKWPIGMFVRANFVNIYSQGMRDRSMRSGTELAREIKLTDWSMAGNLSNRSSGVQIPRDICTRLKRYLYSAKCSWIIRTCIEILVWNGSYVKGA